MTSQGVTYVNKYIGVIALTPRVLLFTFALALFPFISTTIGVSLKLSGLEVWKYLWLVWLGLLAIHVVSGEGFFDKWGGRLETAFWLFITFMLVFAPKGDMVIDPWKSWFFCTLAVVLLRLIVVANANELYTMVKSTLSLWWVFAFILVVHANSTPDYPGGIQHQIFLSGLLGLAAGLLLLLRFVVPKESRRHGFYPFLLVTMLVNVVLNLTITEARSIFPFSLALILIAAAWLLPTSIRPASRGALRFGLPLAFLLTLFPLLHLSGAMGNLVNELTYPIFGKLRTVESQSGREVAFRVWGNFLVENASLIGPAKKPMPAIEQVADKPQESLFGMTQEQFNELKKRGMKAQNEFVERQRVMGVELNESGLVSPYSPATKTELPVSPATLPVAKPGMQAQSEVVERQPALSVELGESEFAPTPPALVSKTEPVPVTTGELAITSSHNQWLDATARSGLVYALAIAWAFGYVVWLISFWLGQSLPPPLLFAYWAMAVAWGFASQFDDEHWLYHIPYLTLFFIPVIASTLRIREQNQKPALDFPAART